MRQRNAADRIAGEFPTRIADTAQRLGPPQVGTFAAWTSPTNPTRRVPPRAAAFHPWGYDPLDFVAHRDRPHVAGNVVSMMVGIEFARDRADLVAPLWKTVRNLADGQLRATVGRCLQRMNAHYNMDLPGLEELLAMEDVTVLSSRLDETIEEWRREAVTEGESRGLSQGVARQRALLNRLAAQRFGPETAERVGSLLDGVRDWERLARAGESIIEADSGEELTRRIRAVIGGSS